jgi:putative Mn2+ efflux pump MntP
LTIYFLIVIVLALSTDAFSGVYLNGFIKEASTGFKILSAVIIAVINAVMAGIGVFVGESITLLLGDFSIGLSMGLLFILGLKLTIKSFKPKFQEMTWELTKIKTLLGFSVALGINSFLLGLTTPLFGADIVEVFLIFTIVFFTSILLALVFGSRSTRFLIASRLLLSGGFIISASAIIFIVEYFKLF